MTDLPHIGAFRFGLGPRPDLPPPEGPAPLLAQLAAPDEATQRWPVQSLRDRLAQARDFRKLRRAQNSGDRPKGEVRKEIRALATGWEQDRRHHIARAIYGPHPFRERLVQFWADHFTVVVDGRPFRHIEASFVDEAIRPHLSGPFRTLLRAAVLHPAMLRYLDQDQSFGPASPAGLSRRRGLNENLAREVMELHTIGPHGGQTQADVRQLAELLTGVTIGKSGLVFRPKRAEPGAETILGRAYGGGAAALADIETALDDLARHPATARHIATKLAAAFVSDDPPADLVSRLEAAFLDSDGDLTALMTTLVSASAAWAPLGAKVRRPLEFIAGALTALRLPERSFLAASPQDADRVVFASMALMGDQVFRAPSPAGLPDRAEDWITPQRLAARLDWGRQAPSKLLRGLPDPGAFAERALGRAPDARLAWALKAADSRAEAVALVLASPQFNRR